MVEPLLRQLRAKGEEFFTELSNNLLANPTFVEMLKKGIEAKEAVDKQVADALKKMNVATGKDVRKLEQRIADLERELAELKEAASPKPRARRARS